MALVKEYTDIEFLNDLNNIVSENPAVSQRDIGERVGISVGVVNGFLKRCLDRGWIATKNLNMAKLQYMVTAEGLKELTKRSISFMKRNFEELSSYKKNIDNSVEEAIRDCKKRIVLYGESRVDFLIEESCRKYGMEFVKRPMCDAVEETDDEVAVIGEDAVAEDDVRYGGVNTVYALVK